MSNINNLNELGTRTSIVETKMSQHVKSLDGFRAVAVIAVLLVHWGILGGGWIGVQIFFVLSGYLITSNLLRDRNYTDSITLYLKNFYWRRFLRLFPAYYLYVFGFILIGLISNNHEIRRLVLPLITYTVNIYATLPKHANLENVGHFWSLAVEFQFYLFWPFLTFYLSKGNFKKTIISLIIIVPVIRLVLFQLSLRSNLDLHHAGEVVNLLTVNQIDAFAMGALVAILPATRIKKPQIIFFIFLLLIIIVGGINLLSLFRTDIISTKLYLFFTFGFPYLMISNYQYVWGYTMLNLLSALLIWCIDNGKNPIPWLNNSFLVYIGKISYGIYIFHVPVLFFIKKMWAVKIISINGLMLFVAYFGITVIIAHVSFKYFETRFLKLKNRVTLKS